MLNIQIRRCPTRVGFKRSLSENDMRRGCADDRSTGHRVRMFRFNRLRARFFEATSKVHSAQRLLDLCETAHLKVLPDGMNTFSAPFPSGMRTANCIVSKSTGHWSHPTLLFLDGSLGPSSRAIRLVCLERVSSKSTGHW